MPRFIITLVFLTMRCFIVTSSSCQSDRNKDHRPRVSCVSQGLTAVPDAINTSTEVLVFTENQFISLSWSMYSGFTKLHELDLSHNHISTLEPPGPVLEKLSVLRLSGNRLTGLEGLVFRGAPNLMEIYLDGNQIRSLHDGTFSELPHLEIINLSQNKLPALPSRLLERVSSDGLKTFDLENNSVSLMPDGFFSSKPDLPYVYLTNNPWLCSCAVGYLHSYLNDQEHNVYMHDGPNDVVPAADSVVCSGPPHLLKRPIIELEENDFCPPDPPDPPVYPPPPGDQDFRPPHVLATTSVKPISITQTLTVPYDTTTDAHPPDSTNYWTTIKSYWVTEIKYFISTPTTPDPPTTAPTIAETQSQATSQPATTPDPPTTAPTIAETQSQATSQPATTPEPPTTIPIISETQSQATDQPELHTFRATTALDTTFGPIIGQPQHQSTAQPELHTITLQTEPPAGRRITPRAEPPISVGPHWSDAREVNGRLLPWCWWLFAGFVFLCVLSALTSCFLFLWLLRNYLVLYRRLKRHVSARSESGGVALRAYRRTENVHKWENEGERVSFLPLEQIKDAQAVFRSVLFISKDEQHQMSETEGNVSSKIELVGDKEQAAMVSGEVFRKTLYRVISREEEAEGWMEEEEHWAPSGAGTNVRYSLILREERGRQGEMQWVVGEWEIGGGGVAGERSCSLIGQPSAVTLE
ncbi:platelet glyco Ib alpha chain-like protein [Labeo rohita]|uniref:Platelet glyco Ib alpha chain-like protein n=1 Tax=Labeo rohita TaxID=84645 RepID=A0A498LK66_LABRO|nr:platelet glyco Ib alpha chain-like protein [Labeo rohita]